MSRAVELTVVIAPDGTTSIDVAGVEGKGCADLARPFEEALGVVTKRDLKPSWYKAASVTQAAKKA